MTQLEMKCIIGWYLDETTNMHDAIELRHALKDVYSRNTKGSFKKVYKKYLRMLNRIKKSTFPNMVDNLELTSKC